jgi:hypothetical protein
MNDGVEAVVELEAPGRVEFLPCGLYDFVRFLVCEPDEIRALVGLGRVPELIGVGFPSEAPGEGARIEVVFLDALNENRRKIAARYNERLKTVVITPPEKPWAKAVYHMYVIRANKRDALAQFLKERGIETGIHYPVPNHQQPAVTQRFSKLPQLPQTEKAVNEILSLPIHGEMSLDDADKVCDAIAAFYQG